MTTKYTYRMPSVEELYAFELQARRMRSQAVAEGFRKGFNAVRGFFSRASTHATRTARHA
jgi:hypothetical protein